MKRIRVFFDWFLVIFLMICIFYFSNQESVVSSGTSNGITRVIFDFFNLDEIFVFKTFHALVRKVAHFSIYGVLGFLLYNALYNSLKNNFVEILILAIVFVFLYAISDEFHQLFVAGRSGEIRDVFIDTSGGSLGAFVYYFYLKIGCVRSDL